MYKRLGISSGKGWDHYRGDLGLKEYSGEIVTTEANADLARASFKLVYQDGDMKLVITERDSQ